MAFDMMPPFGSPVTTSTELVAGAVEVSSSSPTSNSTTDEVESLSGVVAPITQHSFGDLVTVKATFTDRDTGVALDPDEVFVTIEDPDGTKTTYTYGTDSIYSDGGGVYHFDVDVDLVGVWYYRWFATGNGQCSKESAFEIPPVEAVS